MVDELIDEYIERKICVAFITSTDFLHEIRELWDPRWMEAETARLLTSWCAQYFDKYGQAPGRNIEGIYTEELKGGLDKDKGQWIEEILTDLSEKQAEQIDPFLVDRTKKYFSNRQLKLLLEDAAFELDKGNDTGASSLVSSFSPLISAERSFIDPFSPTAKDQVKKAFEERQAPLIRFPGALGQFWNTELIRGGFIALMGAEKRGKTFLLMELGMRAIRSGCKVAFFQAGDMTELQQLRRFSIYLAGRSDQERYCKASLIPTVDCLHHQLDDCSKDVREKDEGVIFEKPEDITWETLVNATNLYPDHIPCHNCKQMKGSPWLIHHPGAQPLQWTEAYRHLRKFGRKYEAQFRLSSHSNETLTIQQIKNYLNSWERKEGFRPDVILIDYADILAPDPDLTRIEYRHQQGRMWQRLRNLSQERNALVATVTQIKAAGYKKELLTLDDFSEDKRKYAHVTAMYGLNQTNEEKRIGLMRINELVIREADFDSQRPVTILQRLQIGRPILGSYW